MDYSLPTPEQTICRVLKVLGNSTFLVAPAEGEPFIASMPPKFRRHIYVKRNGFVVTEPIPEGKKVRGEIVRILQRNQIKHFHQENVWPEAFSSTVYLDNTFSSLRNHRLTDQSDRGIVHGKNFFFMDGENCRAVKKAKDQSSGAGNNCALDTDLDVENYPSIEPNYNKKAVTWIVFSDDDSDEQDDSSDSEEESDDDGGEESDVDEQGIDKEEESEDDEEKSGDDEEEIDDDDDNNRKSDGEESENDDDNAIQVKQDIDNIPAKNAQVKSANRN
ncbi:RNA-binding domain S1 IF1 type [Trinorchestia longiramus]|nr:RNA-binding domain S1 IF1 type [Trinorchestia longiramus]